MDEYVSKNELMQYLEPLTNTPGIVIKRYVEDMPSTDVQPVNRWISVKDRLPDAAYDCLVWYSCDTAFGKCKSWGIAHCSRCDWYTKHLDGDNIEVLYWMPMPEPPQD